MQKIIMKTLFRLSRLVLILFFVMQAAVSFGLEQDAAEKRKVVYLLPSDAPVAAGVPVDELSVLADQGEGLVPVPFQIDEYNEEGIPYFPGTGVKLKGKAKVFDADDRLLFMQKDAGKRLPALPSLPEGKLIAEIELPTSLGNRYVYLARGDSRRSDRRYVEHDVETGVTRTDAYILKADPDNELNWTFLNYAGYSGDRNKSIIDTLKMKIKGGVFTRFATITLTNKNLKPRLIGFKDGPIRTLMQLETRVVVSRIPVMTMYIQAQRYADYYEAHSYAAIPAIFRKTMVNPEVAVSLDGNDMQGATVRTPFWHSDDVVVDGKLSEGEKHMIEAGVTMKDNWLLFDTHQNFIIMTNVVVPDYMLHIPLQLVYQDDPELEVPPERFRGQAPNLGYGIQGMPDVPRMQFMLQILFLDHLQGMEPKAFARYLREKPDFIVNPL